MVFVYSMLIIAADQLTKFIAYNFLRPIESADFIPYVIGFNYVENTGIAFGLFKDMYVLFVPLSIAIVIGGFYYMAKYVKKSEKFLRCGGIFMLSGAIGNIIDKIFRGFVVDFLEFKFVNFPVFNVADIFVTVGAVIVAVAILLRKENENEDNL